MKYLYLLINIFSVALPFLFSFEKKVHFRSYWRGLLPALVITAVVFLVWDEIFTQQGFWGFNPVYLTGIYLGLLPLEEILFFFAIPYASIFIYAAFNAYFPENRFFNRYAVVFNWIFMLACTIGIIFFNQGWYTLVNASFGLVLLILHQFVFRKSYMGNFWRFYFIHLIPFIIVNGILTGTGIEDQVVWYNNAQIIGVRIGTIPIEDTIYSMSVMLMNITIMEYLLSGKFVKR